MIVSPPIHYFRIWRITFTMLRAHFGQLMTITLLLAAPFFLINGIANAHHMMTLGEAAMTGNEIPIEQMRLLWGSLVLADSTSFIALAATGWVMLTIVCDWSTDRQKMTAALRRELPRLARSIAFWIFAVAQLFIFALINTPDGRFKLSGMALLATGMLLLLTPVMARQFFPPWLPVSSPLSLFY